MPTVQKWYLDFSEQTCEEICAVQSCSDKAPDDCEKQGCDPSFCCIKLQILLPISYKNLILFPLEFVLKNNFGYTKNFLFLKYFDIWHPPKSF